MGFSTKAKRRLEATWLWVSYFWFVPSR